MEVTQRILEGTRELFFRHGIKSVTMDEIARHIGVSKKTIYQFYEDKEHLVNALTEAMVKKNMEDITCLFQSSANPLEEIIGLMKHMGKTFSQMNPNLLYDMMKFHPQAFARIRDFKNEQMLKMVESNFRKGIELGLYRADIDIKVLSRLRLEEVELAMRPDIFPPDKFNAAHVQVHLLEHFVHGICTLKGHKVFNKFKKRKEDE